MSSRLTEFNPLMATVAIWVQLRIMFQTGLSHGPRYLKYRGPWLSRVVIFDIRALWRSGLCPAPYLLPP